MRTRPFPNQQNHTTSTQPLQKKIYPMLHNQSRTQKGENPIIFQPRNNQESNWDTKRSAVMDSLAQRCSSRRWPIMIQAQRRAKKTQSAIMVLVLRNEESNSKGKCSWEDMFSGLRPNIAAFEIFVAISKVKWFEEIFKENDSVSIVLFFKMGNGGKNGSWSEVLSLCSWDYFEFSVSWKVSLN